VKKAVAALLLLIAVAGGGIAAYLYHTGEDTGNGRLTLYGNVDLREVQLAFRISERLTAMHAQEGARVEAGELLASVDDRRLHLAVERAGARVKAQAEVLAELEAGTRPQEIEKARAEVAAAGAQLVEARRIYARREDLVARQLASPEEVDNARAALETAQARQRVARESLALAIAGPRQQQIDAARANLEALRAELALARHDLGETRLVSPSAGVIRNRILEPGDMASPQVPVYTLALTDPVWVRAYIPETRLGQIAPGQAARVHSDSFPDKAYEGWVGYISPTAEFTPKSVHTPELRTDLVYQVRVYVCNDAYELRLGMPVTVHIEAGAANAVTGRCAPPGETGD